MAESIEMPFGLWTRVGPKNYVLDLGSDPPCKGAKGEKGREKEQPIVKYKDSLACTVQKRLNRSICRFGCGLRWAK